MSLFPDDGPLWLTDAGLETWLIFHRGVELRDFAAFELLLSPEGRETLSDYYRPFLEMARAAGTGIVLETPTWRASADWGQRLGIGAERLAEVNAEAVAFCRDLARAAGAKALVSGNLGPRGDGYVVSTRMGAGEARRYHGAQVEALAAAGANLVSAFTLGYVEEALGVADAAAAAGVPAVIGFTVETDGRLPDGTALRAAIEAVDRGAARRPAHYLVNCAHPDHFAETLAEAGPWRARIRSLRANASRMSHAELDASETLDDGDPAELAALYARLRPLLPALAVVGGCCGTDHRHVAEMARPLAA